MRALPSLQRGDLLQAWAYELMLLGVATRRYGRAVRLEAGDVPRQAGDGTSKSAVSRRFVAMSQAKLEGWLARDLSELDLVVIQIDGMVVADHTLIVALGIDSHGDKHPLAVMEGATENAAVARALITDLKDRGLADNRAFLWVIDGAKAFRKAIKDHFGKLALIQRCQIHKARGILERLPPHLRAGTSKALRQAFKAESEEVGKKLLENLARRLDQEADGVAGAIREGMPGDRGRHAHLRAPGLAGRSSSLLGQHQSDRKSDRQGASALQERPSLARRPDGQALDGQRHDRGQEGHAPTARLQEPADSAGGPPPP